jgi:hypothetical protein
VSCGVHSLVLMNVQARCCSYNEVAATVMQWRTSAIVRLPPRVRAYLLDTASMPLNLQSK